MADQDPAAAAAAASAAAVQLAAAFIPFNGSIMMAVNTTWLLYGCYLVQLYYYFGFNSGKDRWLKLVVCASAAAATLHLGFGTATQWGILVEHWGDAGVWKATPWESALGPFTSGLNGFIVQLFFASRIIFLSKNIFARISAVVIVLESHLAFGGSIAIMTLFLKGGGDATAIKTLQTVMRLWSISTVITDVQIAATMSLILASAHAQTKFKTTQNLLARLILQSIETGTVTAVTMCLFLICYEAVGTTVSVYMVWEFASGPLYGNVLLFVLNSRQKHIERSGMTRAGDVHTLSDMTPSSGAVSRDMARIPNPRNPGASVKVTTDVLTQYDGDVKDAELGMPAAYNRPHAYVQQSYAQ